MALNIDLLTKELQEIKDNEKQSEASKYIWKPKEGQQIIRIVPYKFNPDTPFVKLQFYYKLGGKNYLAPCTFKKPDPILEFVEKLNASGLEAQKKLAKRLSPKLRTYVPMIERGKEELGVKFWGFGVLVYKALLTVMVDKENWGDITSLTEGNDIKVEFVKESKKKNKETGEAFPDTTVNVLPKKTPVVDPTRTDLVQKIKEQPDILTIWRLPEYAELKEVLDKIVNPGAVSNTDSDEAGDDVDETAVNDANPASVSSVTPAATPATAKEADFGEFEDFFNKNKK